MIIEKVKAEGYSNHCEVHDYVDENELTVTITLNEYRQLISESVENKCRKKHEDWLEQYNRAETAEKKVKELETELNNLYKRMADNRIGEGTQDNAQNLGEDEE